MTQKRLYGTLFGVSKMGIERPKEVDRRVAGTENLNGRVNQKVCRCL